MVWKISNSVELGVSVSSMILANKFWIAGAVASFTMLLLIYSILLNELKKNE